MRKTKDILGEKTRGIGFLSACNLGTWHPKQKECLRSIRLCLLCECELTDRVILYYYQSRSFTFVNSLDILKRN